MYLYVSNINIYLFYISHILLYYLVIIYLFSIFTLEWKPTEKLWALDLT